MPTKKSKRAAAEKRAGGNSAEGNGGGLGEGAVSRRGLDEDVRVPEIGVRRVQIVVMPAFSPPWAWDIRERDGCLRLYRSSVEIKIPSFALSLLGYDELEYKSRELRRYLDRIWSVSIPVRPDLSEMQMRDGVRYELVLFGDLNSKLRLTWSCEGPEQWQPMAIVVQEMVDCFRAAKVAQRTISFLEI